MLDPAWIATIGEAAGEPRADAKLTLGLAQQQQAAVRGLAAAATGTCFPLTLVSITAHWPVRIGGTTSHSRSLSV